MERRPLLGGGRAAVDFVDGGLVGAFDEDFIDAHMWRTAGAPYQGFGDILGDQGFGAFVNFLGLGDITAEADEREFGLGDAGIDTADADAGSVEFQAQGAGDGKFRRFRAAIGGTAFIGDATGDGADVQNVTAGVMGHERQDGAGHAQQPKDIGLNHEFPIRVFAVGHGIGAFGTTGVIDEDIDVRGLLLRPSYEGIHAFRADDIESVDKGFGSTGFEALGGDFFQTIHAAGTEDDVAAFSGESTGGGGTKSAGSTGDNDPFIG